MAGQSQGSQRAERPLRSQRAGQRATPRKPKGQAFNGRPSPRPRKPNGQAQASNGSQREAEEAKRSGQRKPNGPGCHRAKKTIGPRKPKGQGSQMAKGAKGPRKPKGRQRARSLMAGQCQGSQRAGQRHGSQRAGDSQGLQGPLKRPSKGTLWAF